MNITSDELKGLISNSLGIEITKVNEKSSLENIMEWDSLGHLSILNAIDSHFDGKLGDLSDLGNKHSFIDLFNSINSLDQK
jgi:acyl carrier protein